MKVLLDEDLTPKLLHHFPEHEVVTVAYAGWAGLKNGELLLTAEAAGIDVFVTGDKKLQNEHDFTNRKIAVVTLTANNWPIICFHLDKIAAAVNGALPGTLQIVDCGQFSRKRRVKDSS